MSCLEKAVGDRKVVGLVKSALRTPVKVVSRNEDKVLDKLTKRRMKRKKKVKNLSHGMVTGELERWLVFLWV